MGYSRSVGPWSCLLIQVLCLNIWDVNNVLTTTPSSHFSRISVDPSLPPSLPVLHSLAFCVGNEGRNLPGVSFPSGAGEDGSCCAFGIFSVAWRRTEAGILRGCTNPSHPALFLGNYREIQAREKPDGLEKGLKFGRVALLVAEFIKNKEVCLENQDKSQAVLAGWDLKEIFWGMSGRGREIK